MAPTSYEPEFQKLASPASNSPSSGSGTPISFKANVNRAKTRRWVEAKQYSYDGNDWGDEDEDDDYEEEPPPVPQPTNLSQRPGNTAGLPRPSFPAMDRSRSMDQVLTVDPDGASGSRSRSVEGRNAAAADTNNSRPLPFVRPADIYKRMREERGREGSPVVTRANTEPIESFSTGAAQGRDTRVKEDGSTASNVPSKTSQDVPIIGLPDVKRLSGINTDFLGGSGNKNSNTRDAQSGEPQQHQLQHNPSLGFRSAVNQAFDVPETPSSADDSVARSNSASTSAISPIIPSRGLNGEKTPTIVEEPGEMTPKDASDRNIIFKPGHRRDLSVPSPDNSPSRKPKIMDNDQIPQSAIAQLSYTTPSASLEDQTLPSLRQPKRASVQLPSTSGKDLPPPLRVSSNQSNVPVASNNSNPPTVIVPSLSAENSPQDTESDRLRKEIIRSLSRENTPSDEPEQGSRPQTRGGDSLIPSEYERYWNEEAARSPQDQPIADHNSPSTASQGVALNDTPVGPDLAPWQGGSQPKLKKKFSWESSSSEEPEPAAGTYDQPMQDPPVPGQLPSEPDSPPMITPEPNRQSMTEKPKLTIIPPSAGEESSIISGRYLPEVVPQPMESAAAPENDESQPPVPATTAPNPMPPIPSTVLGFRDILGIKSSDERVRAFERTRAQFGAIDTGLNYWIQVTIEAHPEHTDIVGQNLKLSAGAQKQLGKGKFPKLPSLGNFASHRHTEGAPAGHGHVRRTSAPLGAMMNKQQVEQRGKDMLHTAGVLGGRAGEVAKGFFARGRSKFKGNEKGSQSMRAKFSKISGRISGISLGGSGSGDNDKAHHRHTLHLGDLSFPWLRTEKQHKSAPTVPVSGSRQAFTDPAPSIRHADASSTSASVQRPRSLPPQIIWPSDRTQLDLSFPDYTSQWITGTGTQYSTSGPPSHLTGSRMPMIRCVDCDSQSGSQARDRPPSEARAQHEDPRKHEYLRPPHEPLQKPSISSIGTQSASCRPSPASTPASKISLSSEIGQSGFGPQRGHEAAAAGAVQRNTESTRSSRGTFRFYGQQSQDQHRDQDQSQNRNQDSGAGDNERTSMAEQTKDTTSKSSMRKMYQRMSASLSGEKQKKALRRISDLLQPRKDKLRAKSPTPSPQPHNNTTNTNYDSDNNDAFDTDTTNQNNQSNTTNPQNCDRDDLPYHPNDYWDRIRKSESPSITLSSLPSNLNMNINRKPSPLSSSLNEIPESRGRLSNQHQPSYAQDLRLRSRSPRLVPMRPENVTTTASSVTSRGSNGHQQENGSADKDENENGKADDTQATDAAPQHSTFHSINPRTSHMGDQELPWKLRIPGETEEEQRETPLTTTIAPTTAPPAPTTTAIDTAAATPATTFTATGNGENDDKNPQPQHTHIRTINEGQSPIELPVPRHQSGIKDDSSEEVVMSSTAYPGQEWRPAGLSGWEF